MKRRRAQTGTPTTVGLVGRLIPHVIMFVVFGLMLATTTLHQHQDIDILVPICGLVLTMLNSWETGIAHHTELKLRQQLMTASARADYAEAAADQWHKRYTATVR